MVNHVSFQQQYFEFFQFQNEIDLEKYISANIEVHKFSERFQATKICKYIVVYNQCLQIQQLTQTQSFKRFQILYLNSQISQILLLLKIFQVINVQIKFPKFSPVLNTFKIFKFTCQNGKYFNINYFSIFNVFRILNCKFLKIQFIDKTELFQFVIF
ncbi:Hypothetical_protein [Hexamita inflata]|uniref:Hypothetical_protein n=1 Tax=Hexamita inflata TaxID=28002 RepID=A0AA86TY70_9EUKA|nr:Hypothetical protein HINF_LOCUS21780 [Hexamita inflata]